MATLHDQEDRRQLLARLDKLTPQSQRKWGKMDAAQAMWHVAQPLRQATGQLKVAAAGPAILKLGFVRKLVVHYVPLPKGAPTAAEYIAPSGVEFNKAKQELRAAAEQFANHSGAYADNPAFGPMPREDWGILMWKHFDHHLKQFGA